jgi:hypothetical protein
MPLLPGGGGEGPQIWEMRDPSATPPSPTPLSPSATTTTHLLLPPSPLPPPPSYPPTSNSPSSPPSPSPAFSLDEEHLDFSVTPSPRSSSTMQASCQADSDNGAPASKLSYRDVLLSPHQPTGASILQKQVPAAASSQARRPKLRSLLLIPTKQASPGRSNAGRPAAIYMKALGARNGARQE